MNGTILGVWAHPDDEAYLSGGLMAMARDAGARVVCVTATRGELGTADPQLWPPERLAVTRTAELARCLAVLGVTEHHWLGYHDGRCADVPAGEPVARLCELIDDIRPDTVLTFGPDGQTGHPDHQTVGAWTMAAFGKAAPAGSRLLLSAVTDGWARQWQDVNDAFDVFADGYPVTVPEEQLALNVQLPPRVLARKVQALAAQRTQTAGIIRAMGLRQYTEWVREEAFVPA